jgi:hypothetical protein
LLFQIQTWFAPRVLFSKLFALYTTQQFFVSASKPHLGLFF